MKNLKFLCAVVLLAVGISLPASAQENERDYEAAPYTFIGVQGGVQNTLNNKFNNWKTFTPTAALSLGHFFSPEFGARLNVNGIWNKGCASAWTSQTGYYKFNDIIASADVLVNLCTTFGNKDYYPVNLYFIGGLGLFHAWNNTEAADLANNAPYYHMLYANQSPRDAFNGRLGLQLEASLCKNVAFNIEGTYNMHAGDQKTFAPDNNELILLAGLNFKFGFKNKEVEEIPEVWETVMDTIWYDDVTYTDVVKDGNIDKRIFFEIRESDVESSDAQIAAVAEFLKGVENGEITITSYADRGTGNPTINMEYSRARAEKTQKALIEKGVNPSIIRSVNWKGDTEQPYAENDMNRVSIITGHGVYKQQVKNTVKRFKLQEKQVRVQ